MHTSKKCRCHRFLVFLLFFGFLAVFTSSGVVKASTDVPSVINSDTVWTKSASPYEVKGPTLVSNGVVLTVEPGVVVNLNGNYVLVNGTLRAVGSSSDLIQFNGGKVQFSQHSSNWDEQTGLGCVIEYADFSNAYLQVGNSAKISKSLIHEMVVDGSPTVSENTISKITVSGSATVVNNVFPSSIPFDFVVKGGSAVILHNEINCRMLVRHGTPTVSYNTLADGVHADSSGGSVELIGNAITVRGDYYAVYVQGIPAIVVGNKITGVGNNEGITVGGQYNVCISDNIISNCEIGIQARIYGQLTIEGNSITDNHDGVSITFNTPFMLPSEGSSVTFRNNFVMDNSGTGVYVDHAGAVVTNNTVANNNFGIEVVNFDQIIYNNVYGNEYNLKVGVGETVDVTYNYWGTADAQAINQTIYDQRYDFTVGTANYVPFLTEPNIQIPEFPTWTILPILLTITLVATVCRKQLQKR